MREFILRKLFQWFPFHIEGNLNGAGGPAAKGVFSCIICASRPKELEELLQDLYQSAFPKERLEVVLINDGAGPKVRRLADQYKPVLKIAYAENEKPMKIMGALRNKALSLSRGEYVLFLDDDTRLMDYAFLDQADKLFQKDYDVLLPTGHALYGLVKMKYDYLDEFSFANRCCMVRRTFLDRVKGFQDGLKAYEDIDLGIRLTMTGAKVHHAKALSYWHPPLYFDSMRKPLATGQSIVHLKSFYPFGIWLILYLNALRFLPYILLPSVKCHQWAKISWGALGALFIKKEEYY